MRRHYDAAVFTSLAAVLALTGCNQDVAWAGEPDETDDSDGAEGTEGSGGEPVEPSIPDDDDESDPSDPDPDPAPEPGLDDDEKGPTPNPAPEDDEVGPNQPKPLACGNGQLDEGEACDDANDDSSDGCLSDCTLPGTCLVIKTHDPEAEDGPYVVQPAGLEPFEVYCDMSTDGGGYTFLKMDMGQPVDALAAEEVCASMQMQLLIPRTQPHLYSSHWVALDPEVGESASLDYLRMLGIYAAFEGAACDYAPLNSDSAACDWAASDGGPFWISDRIDLDEPSGHGPTQASMAYTFDFGGHVESYAEVAGGGAHSSVFMCDFGDKQ